jgi:hypothetical protein
MRYDILHYDYDFERLRATAETYPQWESLIREDVVDQAPHTHMT